jgi:hypothetical protein
MTRGARALAGTALAALAAVALSHCTSKPAPPRAAPAPDTTYTPVLTVKELMEHIIDPTADWIFDAAVIDVSAKGIQTTAPVSDEDWLRVERGAWLLAESSNLLKMPRGMAPPGTTVEVVEPGKPAPELAPAEIEALIAKDRSLWNGHADTLRDAALEALEVAKARDVNGLFDVGSTLDKACESCHLEYWYPGDKKAVQDDQQKRVTFEPLAQPKR